MSKPWTRKALWATVGLLAAGVAVASPWDIDMVDSRAAKAYGWKMMSPKVEGTLQRSHGAVSRAKSVGNYQNDYVAPGDRMSPEAATMKSPYGDTEAQVKTGEKYFRINCAPCHGLEGKGGGPVTQNAPDQGRNRFMMPAPLLSGDGAVTALRSDGYIYYTIRNGGVGMPAHGILLTDAERWAIVSYIRTLDGAQYTPPDAATTPASSGSAK